MKILQVVHSFPPRHDGIGNYCYQLSKHLVERGHEVEIFTSRLFSNSPIHEFRDGFKIYRCPYFGTIGTNRLTFMINKLLRTEADLIHAHSYIFLTSNQAAIVKRLKKQALLLHLHGGLDVTTPKGNLLTRFEYTTAKNLYDKTIGKWTLNEADLIASVSKRDIELSKRIFEINEDLFRWVPNAVDTDTFRMSESFDSSNHSKYVIFVGSLIPRKGLHIILEIAKRFARERPEISFIIIGDGPLKNYIKRVSDCLHLNLRILSHVERPVLIDSLSKATVFLLPSYSEGLPTVCLEAFACGVPVVASNVGGIPEIVLNGKTGYLVSTGDTQEYAERILELIDDENLRSKMGLEGRKLVEHYYSWEKIVEKVDRLYNSLG